MAGTDALTAPRAVFVEDWWLDAACPGGWSAVVEQRDGRVVGWLPYARYDRDRVRWCGAPPLARLAYPVITVDPGKEETVARARAHVERALILQLPAAAAYEFVLPPHQANALAWQTLGFDARVQHTFVVDSGTSEASMWAQLNSKTRNLIRRAGEDLRSRDIDAAAFTAKYLGFLGGQVDGLSGNRVARLAASALARGQGRALCVEANGQMHAVALFVWDATDYYYFLSARDESAAALGAVDYLVWLGMRDAMARGRRFDFDGVSSSSRRHFLQSFGGRLTSRIVVSRHSLLYDARLLLRRLRHRATHDGVREEFP